jgi:cell division protein FtsQ
MGLGAGYSEDGDSTRPCSGLRTAKLSAKDGTAVLDAPARSRALNPEADGTRWQPGVPSLRRDLSEDFRGPRRRASDFEADGDEAVAARRARSVRLKLRARVPRSIAGRVIAGACMLAGFGVIGFGLWEAQSSLLHDARLTIPSSRSIEISGNNHLTRAQLLSVFGEDVDRNVLTVPLAGRKTELERLPWVEHATVMRLLPNRVRVSIVERTPVAFVRQGSEIGLVDKHGVLLDLSPDSAADHAYSFPVVTGIAATDPASTRAARMKLYLAFTNDLDAGPDKISKRLSEVDLTDPEDVKALIPDNGTDVLVHFGQEDFLTRYQRYEQNLPDWKTKYPKLASVDMRYEREVVLEMAPGTSVPVSGDAAVSAVAPVAEKKAVVVKRPVAKVPAKAKAKPVGHAAGHLEKSFAVRSKAGQR